MIVPLTRRFDEVIPALQAHDMMVSRSGGLGELDRQEDTAPLRGTVYEVSTQSDTAP